MLPNAKMRDLRRFEKQDPCRSCFQTLPEEIRDFMCGRISNSKFYMLMQNKHAKFQNSIHFGLKKALFERQLRIPA